MLKLVMEPAVFSQLGCEYDGPGLELGERTVSVGSGLLLRRGLVYNKLILSGRFDDRKGWVIWVVPCFLTDVTSHSGRDAICTGKGRPAPPLRQSASFAGY